MKTLLRASTPGALCMVAVFAAAGRTEAGFLSSVEVFRVDNNGVQHTIISGTDAVSAAITPYLGTQADGAANAVANADGIGGLVEMFVKTQISLAVPQSPEGSPPKARGRTSSFPARAILLRSVPGRFWRDSSVTPSRWGFRPLQT